MVFLISILVFCFAVSFLVGYRRLLRVEHLNQRLLINGFLGAMVLLTIMTLANWMGFLPQPIAAKTTMGVYSAAAGFFFGMGLKLIFLRKEAGYIEYIYRSFWTDIAPNLIAIALVAYGVFRTGILTWGPFTGIGITSGLSLMGFGFLGWTIRIVPEIRSKGVLLLDQMIPWNEVLTYEWASEETLQIDYLTNEKKLSEFFTYIPPEDQLIIERILGKKIKEYEEERKQTIDKLDEN